MEDIINEPVVILKIPSCPNCQKSMTLLESIGVKYTLIDITKVDFDDIENIMTYLERKTQTRTFPMIFCNGRYVGDFKEIDNLHRIGVLESLLTYRM
jgi:glutaredoxin